MLRIFGPVTLLTLLIAPLAPPGQSASEDARYYNIGSPVMDDIWVDPVHGSDENVGDSRDEALLTLSAAWERIPIGQELTTTGYHIRLAPGDYEADTVPIYWESRYGTYDYPIVIEAADGPGTVTLPDMNVYDTRYLYLLNLAITGQANNIFHCERCDHVLIRGSQITGTAPETYQVQETLKVNQSQYIYIEDSDISGAWNPAIDFVAVQYGHIQGSRIHNAGDWCVYLKGGSAYFRIEGNEIFDCGTGGFTAGQGTGFEYMVSPWLHYETYDIRFLNNVIHDTNGAGMGVNGGYNILLAYNTLYRVGAASHALEFGYGARSCDGNTAICEDYLAAGGWGPTGIAWEDSQPIPNRNVFVYNNILYNPPGYQSQWQQFAVYGPNTPGNGTNIPSPVRADDNLQIRGNIIWNGEDLPLGVGDDQGCQPANMTCNAAQLTAENAINSVEPELVDPENGDFRPVPDSNVFHRATYPIPNFPGNDRSAPPVSPAGDLSNGVALDYAGHERGDIRVAGAFVE
jgi:hypothetical protein